MRLNPRLSLRQYQEVLCLQIRRSKGDAIVEDRHKCGYCNYVFFFSASEPKVPTVRSSSALNPWQTPRWSPGGISDGKKPPQKTEEARAESNIYTAYRWGFFLKLRSLLAQVPDHWGTFIPETSDTSPSTVATLQRMIKLTVSDMARFFYATWSQKRSGFRFSLWLMVQFFFFYVVGPVRCSEKTKDWMKIMWDR